MTQYFISIDKDSVSQMPAVTYDGKITLVDTPEKARLALKKLEKQKIVGFDTETRPAFRKGVIHNVALIQIATLTDCYLFRINIIGISERLKRFLETDDTIKIGLSLRDDFNSLRRSTELEPKGFVELQDLVRSYNITDSSLRKIYAIIFGERISKHQRLTNWEAPELTPAQQNYAAIDAWACLKIHNYLTANQFDPSRSPHLHPIESKTI